MPRARANPRLLIRYLRWGVYAGIAAPVVSVFLIIDNWSAEAATAAAGLVVGVAGLELVARWSLDRVDPTSRALDRRWLWVAIGVVAVATIAQPVVLGLDGPWPPGVGALVLLASCLVAMPLRLWRALLVALAVMTAGSVVLVLVRGATEPTGRLVGVWMVLVPTMIIAWWTTGWMLRVMRELEEARDQAATAAVAEERARISRDLHDLFGQTLATIAVKSELAAELSSRGRHEPAIAEMREVHRIADESGGRVRAVVRGERQTSLDSELAGARALLGSAQIVCRVTADPIDHPHTDVLAWVLRESVTNVLRHTNARTVELQVAPTADGGARLQVSNDDPPADDVTEGGGLTGMRDRVEGGGGTLTVGRDGDWFRVVATLPSERSRS